MLQYRFMSPDFSTWIDELRQAGSSIESLAGFEHFIVEDPHQILAMHSTTFFPHEWSSLAGS